ncbi:hypothetical protein GCM10009551_050540 [Nocardiopsis tropica]
MEPGPEVAVGGQVGVDQFDGDQPAGGVGGGVDRAHAPAAQAADGAVAPDRPGVAREEGRERRVVGRHGAPMGPAKGWAGVRMLPPAQGEPGPGERSPARGAAAPLTPVTVTS